MITDYKLFKEKRKEIFSGVTSTLLINYFIVALAFAIPISKAGTSFFEILLLLFWIIEGNFKSKFYEIRQSKFILTMIALIVLSIISLLWSSDIHFATNYIFKYWHFSIILVIYTSLDKKYLESIFSAFLLGMFISEITSYGIFFEIWNYKNISPNDPSPFMDHSNYSSYLAFTVLILVYRIKLAETIKWKMIYGVYLICSLSNLFINGGRTGQVIFLLSIFVLGLQHYNNKIRAIIYSLIASSLLFFVAYTVSPIFESRISILHQDFTQIVEGENYTNGFSQRVALWMIGTKNFINEPFLGTGIGDEAFDAKEELEKIGLETFITTKDKYCRVDYHNNFVQYLVQLGLVGLILFLSLFYYLLKLDIKEMPYKDLKISFVILYLLWTMIGQTFHLHHSMLFFTLFSAIFLVLGKPTSKNI